MESLRQRGLRHPTLWFRRTHHLVAEWAEECEGVATMSTRDEAVYLTPTERLLLAYLVRNEGRIVGHGELLDAMSITRIGTLRQWIRYLCTKIEIDPALPRVIITHHRQGYSFAGKEEGQWFPEMEMS